MKKSIKACEIEMITKVSGLYITFTGMDIDGLHVNGLITFDDYKIKTTYKIGTDISQMIKTTINNDLEAKCGNKSFTESEWMLWNDISMKRLSE